MARENKHKQQVERRRGRPTGKNRIPLTKEEKRARNAQYERERRQENTDATRDLALELGIAADTAQVDVLATASAFIASKSSSDPQDDLTHLRGLNKKLMAYIADAERRLAAELLPVLQLDDGSQGSSSTGSDTDTEIATLSAEVAMDCNQSHDLDNVEPMNTSFINWSDYL